MSYMLAIVENQKNELREKFELELESKYKDHLMFYEDDSNGFYVLNDSGKLLINKINEFKLNIMPTLHDIWEISFLYRSMVFKNDLVEEKYENFKKYLV